MPRLGRAISGVVAGLALLCAASVAAAATTILALGDSLTAGYGLDAATESFPVKLERALTARGLDVRVINAGVSGDTTAAGRARLDWVLQDPVDLVILELGANDMLRGVPPNVTHANLDAMLGTLAGKRIRVLLAGMLAAPNMGRDYRQSFDAVYPQLAAKHGVPFYPFFLDGVAAEPTLLLNDGLHPTSAGIDVIVERILPYVLWAMNQGPRPAGT